MDIDDVRKIQGYIETCLNSLDDLKTYIQKLNDGDDLTSDEVAYLDYAEEAYDQIKYLSLDFNSNSGGGTH
jgi:hypothetical protein